ncbi:beta-class carbonic anhydrase [Niallia taxi]|uniref:beta-class carbonic anhydrase n=1 Tax=Niallia taxi TaxID=2499688 RepID=UPI00119E4714|nr:carbonic anhydrase [Niallia taxi]MCT2347555.1 carbonic anhydrase [Niallia taxi]MED3965689.1 carbonic anhydrase [Niallia taxi]WOD63983.1 carbonic anhydrase [Niallia taxi]
MTLLNDILTFNEEFVAENKYERYITTKFPNKKMVILTCMDTRLLELLPHALNLSNGDVKLVKNAGAMVVHPFGSIMRSILVAVYELKADEVMIIGHHDCGMSALNYDSMLDKMKDRGISDDTISTLENSGMDLDKWLTGFSSVEESVSHSVKMVKNHPLLPPKVPVHGLVIDPKTGKLDLVVDGYKA